MPSEEGESMKRLESLVVAGVAALWCVAPSPAGAEKPALQITPGTSRLDATQRDLAPRRPDVPDARGFVAPLTKRTATGRAGIAGFTVPNPSVGSRATAEPENSGWLGVGFAVEWGVPGRRARD
jgi:hypothetical protein